MKVLPYPCFYPNGSSYGLVLQTMKFHEKKNNCFSSEHIWDFKKLLQKINKMLSQCSYSCKFPASSIFSSAECPVGARSRFRWKLHPSSQAWLLLSTSNRGETAIAKCGNREHRKRCLLTGYVCDVVEIPLNAHGSRNVTIACPRHLGHCESTRGLWPSSDAHQLPGLGLK